MIDRNASCILAGFRPECILAGPKPQDIFDFICESIETIPEEGICKVIYDPSRAVVCQFTRPGDGIGPECASCPVYTKLAMGIASALNLAIQYATLGRLLHVGLVHGPNDFPSGAIAAGLYAADSRKRRTANWSCGCGKLRGSRPE
jgi:hypothetical protein